MSHDNHITINGVPIEWDVKNGTFTFFGLKSALFWINPSLLTMLKPIAEEIGHDLFRLMVASSASQGTEEDYHVMVTQLGDHFEQGFCNWGKAVSSAGWGTFELREFDITNNTATVRVSNTWELLLGSDLNHRWGCPFIQGKLIGIFSHAFNQPCWADETEICYQPEQAFVEYSIYPSEKTIAKEIDTLRLAHMQDKERDLEMEVREKTSELHKNEGRFRQLTEMSSDWIWEMNQHLQFSYFSDNYFRHTGHDPSYSIGKTRHQLCTDEDRKKTHWKKHLDDLENHREFRDFQYEFVGPDGTRRHLQISGSPVFDEQQTFLGYRGTATDITEMVKAYEAVEQAKIEAEANLEKISELNLQLQTEIAHKNQALTRLNFVNSFDNLTETPNRSQIKHRIQELQQNIDNKNLTICLLVVSLNEIEHINQEYGLEVGDAVIVETSIMIKECIDEQDMVARSKGSDFIVLLPQCDSQHNAMTLAQQIVDRSSQPFESAPDETISFSIGILMLPLNLESTDKLFSRAYQTMHQARKLGKTIHIELDS